jgi:peptidoglycan hydrolase-like protein with peptidoglycan-binding domain
LFEDQRDLSTCAPWERSLASSRKRRRLAAAARRRRLRSRGGTSSLVAVLLATAVVGTGIAVGQSGGGSQATAAYLTTGSSGKSVAAVQRKLGLRATGYFGRSTRRAVRRFQRRHGLLVDGVVGPQTLGALGLARATSGQSSGSSGSSTSSTAGGGSGTLARIASCESGGNPRAVGGGGRYRGKYQFDRATWRAVGGSGDPAAAPEAEQDRRAASLLARSGTGPWRNCAG